MIKKYYDFINEATELEYKEFFKDKINWRFLNFINDCCQEFIDSDEYIKIGVVSKFDNTDNKNWIYNYSDNKYTPMYDSMEFLSGMYLLFTMNLKDNEKIINAKNNIYYRLVIGHIRNEVTNKQIEILNKIIMRIKSSKIYKNVITYPLANYKGVIDIELEK